MTLANKQLAFFLTVLFILSCVLDSAALAHEAPIPIPEDSMKILPLAAEKSVSTFLPSTSVNGQGLAINIIYPEKPRYKNGAPVAVVIPGGDTANGLNFCMHAAQVGFIEIRFSFPGGGIGDFRSPGNEDYRGTNSQKALRDILLFAAGRTKDFRNRSISELLPIKVSPNNVGLVGWSNGGNIALITMEKYAKQLSFINWLALYECPLGSLFFPPSLGSTHDFLLNKHYREGSAATGHCLLDYRKLSYQGGIRTNPGIHKKLGEPELPGIIYFDDNKNNRWDETTEFAFNYSLARGLNKKIYPPDVTAAMERLKIFDQAQANAVNQKNNAEPNDLKSESNPLAPKVTNVATTPISTKAQANNTSATNTSSTASSTNKPATVSASAKLIKMIKKPKPVPVDTNKNKVSETKTEIHYWPRSIAKLEESENYFRERDGSLAISTICSEYPNLLITIFASQVDHLQTQPDHPHIILQYNAFLENNAHWVRLNPESIYLGELSHMNKRNFVQNAPNTPVEAEAINDYLEPEGALKDYTFMNATIAELADRTRSNNLQSPLEAPIYTYTNGISELKTNQPNTAETNKNGPKPNN